MSKTFVIDVKPTKHTTIFMNEIVEIMNSFSGNKKYLMDIYSKMEEDMSKEKDYEPVPFEAACIAVISDKQDMEFRYSTQLYYFVYREYEYITHENKNNPFIYDCLKHAINWVECNGLRSFVKTYSKSK
jgi:heme oxygenase